MDLVELGDIELTYSALKSLDFDVGGQLYGTMDGAVTAAVCVGRCV